MFDMSARQLQSIFLAFQSKMIGVCYSRIDLENFHFRFRVDFRSVLTHSLRVDYFIFDGGSNVCAWAPRMLSFQVYHPLWEFQFFFWMAKMRSFFLPKNQFLLTKIFMISGWNMHVFCSFLVPFYGPADSCWSIDSWKHRWPLICHRCEANWPSISADRNSCSRHLECRAKRSSRHSSSWTFGPLGMIKMFHLEAGSWCQ